MQGMENLDSSVVERIPNFLPCYPPFLHLISRRKTYTFHDFKILIYHIASLFSLACSVLYIEVLLQFPFRYLVHIVYVGCICLSYWLIVEPAEPSTLKEQLGELNYSRTPFAT